MPPSSTSARPGRVRSLGCFGDLRGETKIADKTTQYEQEKYRKTAKTGETLSLALCTRRHLVMLYQSKHLKRLGGVDAADHVKKSMAATMTNKMMAIMSLRGRSGKVSFMKTHLYKLICDAVFSSFDTTTTKINEHMAKYLKYAPERMGGSGRKKER
ncbi:hypothetical protein QQF64_018805 [Cirrhinus molitorella]|uniref:Uncharacterized protein n=1 Tax=Cirrhinus molitorella TaxID=172907 RepID=A0ABR3LH42_9TELE